MLDSLLRRTKARNEKMNSNERSESSAKIPRPPFPDIFTNSANSIAIYTVLCILRRMKREVGLEAMMRAAPRDLELAAANLVRAWKLGRASKDR